tara:strand:+ start:965 stop:1810 length:846 start_codon:yes stop_codon:yes gene_type:complete
MEQIKVAVNLNALGVSVQMANMSTTGGGGGTVDVSNSDDTYFVSVSVPNSHELPNVTHIDPFGNNFETPAQTPFNSESLKTGIVYNPPIYGGQNETFHDFDANWNRENGVYTYARPAFPTSFAALDYDSTEPFLTLLPDNKYGNKHRFTDIYGTMDYVDLIVEDNLTNRSWTMVTQTARPFESALNDSKSSTYGGLNGWRVPTTDEMLSIADYRLPLGSLNYPPFNLPLNGVELFTCETLPADETQVITLFFNLAAASLTVNINREIKTNSRQYLMVRNTH